MSDVRQQSFEGQIKKCPSCGAVLPSMATKCPECGLEIRGAESSNSLQIFYNELRNSYGDTQLDVIAGFPIPNTKEDFFEFLALAKSQVETSFDIKNNDESGPGGWKLHNAWMNKFKQCKVKADVLFINDPQSYQLAMNIIKGTKPKRLPTTFFVLIIVLGGMSIAAIILSILGI